MLVELVVRLQTSLDLIVLEQDRTCAGVLSQNQIRLLQDTDRPNVISSRFPTGVGTIYNIPAIRSLLETTAEGHHETVNGV